MTRKRDVTAHVAKGVPEPFGTAIAFFARALLCRKGGLFIIISSFLVFISSFLLP